MFRRKTPGNSPRQSDEGSWGEAFVLTLLTFQIVAVPLLAIVFALGLVALTIWALMNQPLLAVFPIATIVGVMWWFSRFTKQAEDDIEEDLLGPGRRL